MLNPRITRSAGLFPVLRNLRNPSRRVILSEAKNLSWLLRTSLRSG